PDIQLLDWHANGGAGRCSGWCVAEVRMKLFELPHLSVSAPTCIASTSISQVKARDFIEIASCIEARGQLVRDGLVVNKTACPGRTDRALVEAFVVKLKPLNGGYFGRNPR